jgi:hypothetical protein
MLSTETTKLSNNLSTLWCDTHVVANSISSVTVELLQKQGFHELKVVNGDTRVRMQSLWSKKSSSAQNADECYEQSKSLIQQDAHFVGYIEEEVMELDEPITPTPFNEDVWGKLLPILAPSPCPDNMIKACDIHLSLHNVNPLIDQKLLNAGFYFLELYKPSIGNVRIYTMQTQKPKKGREILNQLQQVVSLGGGVEGFLKFEITKNLYNQGFSLPPILMG